MLLEELTELKEAVTEVDKLDALNDLRFLIDGTISKMDLTPEQEVESYEVVIQSNLAKGSQKDENGKIIKPDGWEKFKPEPKLQTILDNRGK